MCSNHRIIRRCLFDCGFTSDSKLFQSLWRQRHTWRAAHVDLNSAPMANEQLGFFSMPRRHRTSLFNGHIKILHCDQYFHFTWFQLKSFKIWIIFYSKDEIIRLIVFVLLCKNPSVLFNVIHNGLNEDTKTQTAWDTVSRPLVNYHPTFRVISV